MEIFDIRNYVITAILNILKKMKNDDNIKLKQTK
jgi:hypothetical protein